MAASKSQKIQAEIDKVKAKIAEQQARLKELEQKKLEAENKASRSPSPRNRSNTTDEPMDVIDGGLLCRRSFMRFFGCPGLCLCGQRRGG